MSRFIRIDDAATDERTEFFEDILPEELIREKGCRLIGAVDEKGLPEGVVAFSVRGNMTELLHLQVYRKLRRRGIGTALIRTLLRYLSLAELPFILQAVYAVGEGEEENVTDLFFRSIPDFEIISGGRYYTVTPDTLWNSARLSFVALFRCSVTPYHELSNTARKRLLSELEEKGYENLLLEGRGDIIPELSLCHVEEDVCTTCVIFRESELPHTLELSFLVSKPKSEQYLAGVLNEVRKRFQTSYRDYNLVFSLVNKESELLAKRFILDELRVTKILTAVSFGEV